MYPILFLILAICMIACHLVAKRKGYNPVAWGMTGAVLGPIAVLIVLLLKDKKNA